MSAVLAGTDDGHKKLAQRIDRLRHEKRVRFWRVVLIVAFFVVALCSNLFIGAAMIHGDVSDLLPFSFGKNEEPIHRAKIRRPLLDGTFCRNIVFDNATAQALVDNVERCDGAPRQPGYLYGVGQPQFRWGTR